MSKGNIKGELWVPALCEECGTIFQTHLRVPGRRYGRMKLLNHPDVFCPKCNAKAVYKEEYIYILEDAYKAIKKRRLGDLIELRFLLKSHVTPNMTTETYAGAKGYIEKALPELRSFRDFIPKTRMEAYTLLGSIFVILTFVVTCLQSGEQPSKQQALSTVIVNYDPGLPQKTLRETNTNATKKTIKTGRNEKCYCGSGLKFKRCHGRAGSVPR